MSLFSRSGSSGSVDQNARKAEVMSQLRQEFSVVSLQELVNKLTEKCYTTCLPSSSSSLTSTDQACLQRCSGRYLEAFDVVSRTYVERLRKEQQAAAAANPLQVLPQ